MCGIVGAYSLDGLDHDLEKIVVNLLDGNKNRGQDGYGISVLFDDGELETYKFSNKVVKKVKKKVESILVDINGDNLLSNEEVEVEETVDCIDEIRKVVMGFSKKVIGIIGHARYPTSGSKDAKGDHNQPFAINIIETLGEGETKMNFAFNGNIVNAEELALELEAEDQNLHIERPILDTQVLKHMIQSYIHRGITDVQEILQLLNERIDGACNIVILSKDGQMGFSKDKNGFKPLSWEKRDGYMVLSSESSALFSTGGKQQPNFVHAGERVMIQKKKQGELLNQDGIPIEGTDTGMEIVSDKMNLDIRLSSCFFEAVYFADRKTEIFGKQTSAHRYQMGKKLGEAETENFTKKDTVVVDIPSSSKDAAEGLCDALRLGEPYSTVITKNPDVGRTFIAPGETRMDMIKRKYLFNPLLKIYIKGKKVLLVDDSIVRGSTMKYLVQAFIDYYEPAEVHLRIPSPPITSPCYYGINMAEIDELVVRKFFRNPYAPTSKELDELASFFNSNSLKYLSIPQLGDALDTDLDKLCLACVNSQYKTPCGRQKYQEQSEEYNKVRQLVDKDGNPIGTKPVKEFRGIPVVGLKKTA